MGFVVACILVIAVIRTLVNILGLSSLRMLNPPPEFFPNRRELVGKLEVTGDLPIIDIKYLKRDGSIETSFVKTMQFQVADKLYWIVQLDSGEPFCVFTDDRHWGGNSSGLSRIGRS